MVALEISNCQHACCNCSAQALSTTSMQQQLGLGSSGCWQLGHSVGGVDSPPPVGSCMRASCASSVDLHDGSVVGARVAFHSVPIAFLMPQGCLCRIGGLRLGWGALALRPIAPTMPHKRSYLPM